MGAAQSGIVDAAEGQQGVEGMHHGVVDAGASRRGAVEDAADACAILAPDVKRQRLFTGIDAVNDLVEFSEPDHRQQGSENLLLQDRGIRRHALEDGR